MQVVRTSDVRCLWRRIHFDLEELSSERFYLFQFHVSQATATLHSSLRSLINTRWFATPQSNESTRKQTPIDTLIATRQLIPPPRSEPL